MSSLPARPGVCYTVPHAREGESVEEVNARAIYGKARLKHVVSLLGDKHIRSSLLLDSGVLGSKHCPRSTTPF